MTTLEMAARAAAIRMEFERYRIRIWRAFEKHLQLEQRVDRRTTRFECVVPDCEGHLALDGRERLVCTDCGAPSHVSTVLDLSDHEAAQAEYDDFRSCVMSTIESAACYEMKRRNHDLYFDCLNEGCPGTLHLDGDYSLHCTHCDRPNNSGCLGRHQHPCPSHCGHYLHIDCMNEVRCEHCDGLCGMCNQGPEPSHVPFPKLNEIADYLGIDFARPDGVDNDEAVSEYLNGSRENALAARLRAIKIHIPRSLYVHFGDTPGSGSEPCYPCPGCEDGGTLFLDDSGSLYCDYESCAVNSMALDVVAA